LVLLGFLISTTRQATVSDAEECSGICAAIKKSRVSLRVKRTMLRHEARVLQLLQGHPAIPTLFGYQRLPHFEYIAVDLLGRHMKGVCKSGYSLKIGTVARIAEQMVFEL
jgi:predicted Ser/Thr protein kinase